MPIDNINIRACRSSRSWAPGLSALVTLGLLLPGSHASAADQGITGKLLLLKSKPKLVLLSKDPAISATGYDPVGGNDSSISFDSGGGPVTYSLPKILWSTNGSGTLFKYKNTDAPGGPSVVRAAKVKAGLLKVIATDVPFAVPNGAATIDVLLNLDGYAATYCMTFSGTGDGSKLLVKDAAAGACPLPPPPVTFNFTGSVQTYTIPDGVTSVNIDASGAQGGGSFGGAGGLGARMTGNFAVTPGEELSIVVGQQGLLQVGGDSQNSSGGGGGTFVFASGGPTLLVAAGGGGGKCNFTSSSPLHAEAAGQVTTSGGASSDGNPGGVGGAGGPAGLWDGIPCAGGGTGWVSVGGGPYGGIGYNTWTGGPGFCDGGGGGCGGVGGFGGGGGGGNHYGGGGGGGGYSGGGGGTDPTHGGGGGSFSSGTSQVNTVGYKSGDGEVTITHLE